MIVPPARGCGGFSLSGGDYYERSQIAKEADGLLLYRRLGPDSSLQRDGPALHGAGTDRAGRLQHVHAVYRRQDGRPRRDPVEPDPLHGQGRPQEVQDRHHERSDAGAATDGVGGDLHTGYQGGDIAAHEFLPGLDPAALDFLRHWPVHEPQDHGPGRG